MKVYLISDEDYNTPIYQKLSSQVVAFFQKKGFEIVRKSIKKGELHFCIGCFGCWTKKPGECVINDDMAQINRTFNMSDVVVYLTPIVFGQYSPNIENAIDRWLPNVLPLFVKKPDGTTEHPPRYSLNPNVVVIGYGNTVSQEEAQLFINIVKHKSGVEAFVYFNDRENIAECLDTVRLERIRG